jgi:hypothetical protein
MREELVPVLDKLCVSLRKLSDELVVDVHPIVHTVMTDEWLFSVYYLLYYERPTHF